eukprot:GILJ01011521.1.p1 GENE.GILJ01011521.1~~GILJ01011521.1.p1  ORF type:complete len:394 (-),score=41.83 GILJ01011521.1:184-1365(-)
MRFPESLVVQGDKVYVVSAQKNGGEILMFSRNLEFIGVFAKHTKMGRPWCVRFAHEPFTKPECLVLAVTDKTTEIQRFNDKGGVPVLGPVPLQHGASFTVDGEKIYLICTNNTIIRYVWRRDKGKHYKLAVDGKSQIARLNMPYSCCLWKNVLYVCSYGSGAVYMVDPQTLQLTRKEPFIEVDQPNCISWTKWMFKAETEASKKPKFDIQEDLPASMVVVSSHGRDFFPPTPTSPCSTPVRSLSSSSSSQYQHAPLDILKALQEIKKPHRPSFHRTAKKRLHSSSNGVVSNGIGTSQSAVANGFHEDVTKQQKVNGHTQASASNNTNNTNDMSTAEGVLVKMKMENKRLHSEIQHLSSLIENMQRKKIRLMESNLSRHNQSNAIAAGLAKSTN